MRRWRFIVPGCIGAIAFGGLVYSQDIDLSYAPHEGPGEVTRDATPKAILDERIALQQKATRDVGAPLRKEILFGDLHVHTTFSQDAFMMSLPMLSGAGAHPPADACDYARFCSAVDFWSINDHAESITPQRWAETKESIRACNGVSETGRISDVVAFLGWEWTQSGATPDAHFGHKNVILRYTDEDKVPARPIAAASKSATFTKATSSTRPEIEKLIPLDPKKDTDSFLRYARFMDELALTPDCDASLPSNELPAGCTEWAATPRELFDKLDQQNVDAIVIPHGTAWGFYTPPGASWDNQLNKDYNDPKRQFLVEIFSGHGNSEEYRDYRAVAYDAQGKEYCPQPSRDYLPSCWRAGEIIEARCLKSGQSAQECEKRADDTRKLYLQYGTLGWRVVPATRSDEWLDAGQCRDCFLPAFNMRPLSSAQYMTAISNFDEPGKPQRFRFGYMAASDNHHAQAGSGYKEFGRVQRTETLAPPTTAPLQALFRVFDGDPEGASPIPLEQLKPYSGFARAEIERLMNFSLTGGLTAAHVDRRSRDGIWNALQRKEVYATSGDKILLWFDLINSPAGVRPMGSYTLMKNNPQFRVRAVGAFKQKPGCPEYSSEALGEDRLKHLCHNECDNPSETRKLITRIEVIRILPQRTKGEDVSKLIQDPWRVFKCEPKQDGCVVEFSDDEFATKGRDAAYYVRAIEEPSNVVNAGNLRCERDAKGNCIKVNNCFPNNLNDKSEDCLAPAEERAWSSPIYIDKAG